MNSKETSNIEVFPFVVNDEFMPHIAVEIFNKLNRKELIKCRTVCSIWKDFIDSETPLWSKVSQSRFTDAALKGQLDICKLIVDNAVMKNPKDFKGKIHGVFLIKMKNSICRNMSK